MSNKTFTAVRISKKVKPDKGEIKDIAKPNGESGEVSNSTKTNSIIDARKDFAIRQKVWEQFRDKNFDPERDLIQSYSGKKITVKTLDKYSRYFFTQIYNFQVYSGTLDQPITKIDLEQFLEFFWNQKSEYTKQTWNCYRCSICANAPLLFRNKLPLIKKTLYAKQNPFEIVLKDQAGSGQQDKSLKPLHSSEFKDASNLYEKGITKKEFDAIHNELIELDTKIGQRTSVWLKATISTGLRSEEWQYTYIHEEEDPSAPNNRRIILYLLISKSKKRQRDHKVRGMDISAFQPSTLDAIYQMVALGNDWYAKGNYHWEQAKVALCLKETIAELNQKLAVEISRKIRLKSSRHQFTSNMRLVTKQKNVSALLGHSSIYVTRYFYGKIDGAWDIAEIVDIPEPLNLDIENVQ